MRFNVEEYISPVAWHISVVSHFCVTIDLSGINLFQDLSALLSLQQLSELDGPASCNLMLHPSTWLKCLDWCAEILGLKTNKGSQVKEAALIAIRRAAVLAGS